VEGDARHALKSGGDPHILVFDEAGGTIAEARMARPVPVIHKHRWWNLFFGNPLGYLPADGPIDHIRADLPRQQHLSFGPLWMRGWEFIFFMTLLAVSIGLKLKLKIA
jgi:hypothetical protein